MARVHWLFQTIFKALQQSKITIELKNHYSLEWVSIQVSDFSIQ